MAVLELCVDSGERIGHAEARQRLALDYCSKQMVWYWYVARKNRRLYNAFRVLTIILAGITPVLILIPNLPGGDVTKAAPAALVAV